MNNATQITEQQALLLVDAYVARQRANGEHAIANFANAEAAKALEAGKLAEWYVENCC